MEKIYEQQVLSVDQGKRCLWLWQSVLYQSLLDVTFAGLATENIRKEAFKVTKWIKTEDFQMVCEFANVNAEHVANVILKSYEKSLNDYISKPGKRMTTLRTSMLIGKLKKPKQ